jgi:hypothetical protein
MVSSTTRCSPQIKSKIDNILSKTTVLQINLNIDDDSIGSRSHNHLSHSQTLLSNNLVFIFRCSSPPRNPRYVSRVDPSTLGFLVFLTPKLIYKSSIQLLIYGLIINVIKIITVTDGHDRWGSSLNRNFITRHLPTVFCYFRDSTYGMKPVSLPLSCTVVQCSTRGQI